MMQLANDIIYDSAFGYVMAFEIGLVVNEFSYLGPFLGSV